jgi:hypothetical protein
MNLERDPIAKLKELVSQRDINVLFLGDWEFPGSAHRNYIHANISRLADQFDTLALELNPNVTPALNALNNHEISGLEFGESIRPHGYDAGSLYVLNITDGVISYPPDPGYFGSLQRARDAAMRLVAIDEPFVDGAYTYRDDYMHKEILNFVRAGKKAIVLGGFRHHYRRPKPGQFKTTTELLTDYEEIRSLSVLFESGDLELIDLQLDNSLFWQEAVSGGENAREIGGLVRTGAQRCAAIATR